MVEVHLAILSLSILWLIIGLVITFWSPRNTSWWMPVKMMLAVVWVGVGMLDLISFYMLWTFHRDM
jgi:hypothetical protein